jgi:uncharacterized protein (TIGR00255 family)
MSAVEPLPSIANKSMPLSSMTGFARSHGASGPYSFAWEIKSVNAKGLDLRLRLPPGWDAIEQPIRAKAAEALARGTVYANLAVDRPAVQPVVRINDQVLAAVLATLDGLADRVQAELPRLDGILAIKGVVEVAEADENEKDRATAENAVVRGFAAALAELAAMRRHEGEALSRVLAQRLADIAGLIERAEAAPGRKPEAIKERLARQVALLLEASERFDPDRLHQEAIVIAAKADVREELDRLNAHVAQARELVSKGGAVGRRLDFLAQELNREANTLCAKANDIELTKIGLELKNAVEQFREQVQNLE